MSFQERAMVAMEKLSKQYPITLEKAREQAQQIKTKSSSENKKKRG